MGVQVNPNIVNVDQGSWAIDAKVISCNKLSDKRPAQVFAGWAFPDLGNTQNVCKLVRLVTELLVAIPYIEASRCADGLKKTGEIFEKFRDLPVLTYFGTLGFQIFLPDESVESKKKEKGLELTKSWLNRVKVGSDFFAMGILTSNILNPIFSSSESRLMQYLDLVSFTGDVSELGKYSINWYQNSKDSKKAPDSIFYMRMTGVFISAVAGGANLLKQVLKRDVAPVLALKIASAVGTSLKLYASYSEYSRIPVAV